MGLQNTGSKGESGQVMPSLSYIQLAPDLISSPVEPWIFVLYLFLLLY